MAPRRHLRSTYIRSRLVLFSLSFCAMAFWYATGPQEQTAEIMRRHSSRTSKGCSPALRSQSSSKPPAAAAPTPMRKTPTLRYAYVSGDVVRSQRRPKIPGAPACLRFLRVALSVPYPNGGIVTSQVAPTNGARIWPHKALIGRVEELLKGMKPLNSQRASLDKQPAQHAAALPVCNTVPLEPPS